MELNNNVVQTECPCENMGALLLKLKEIDRYLSVLNQQLKTLKDEIKSIGNEI